MAAIDASDEQLRRDVALLVEEACGERPTSLAHMWVGMANTTFEAVLANRSMIVRTNIAPHAFDATCANLGVLSQLGLPVPRVVAAGVAAGSSQSFAYMILEKIPGRDLRFELPTMTKAQQSALAEQVLAAQDITASIPSKGGYGFAAIGHRGPMDSWRAVLRSPRKLWRFLPGQPS